MLATYFACPLKRAHFLRIGEVEVERYANDPGLCSLLKGPWPQDSSH